MTKILDMLALPFLATFVVACFAYIWIAWLSDKDKRALRPNEDGGYDDVDPDSERPAKRN
jgi:hypothetical protein